MIYNKFELFLEYNNNFGEWIDSLIDDDFVKVLVDRYIENISPDISVKNAVNILNNFQKKQLEKQIKDYLENGLRGEEVDVRATSTEISKGDFNASERSLLKVFLRAMVALGIKEMQKINNETTKDYLFLYRSDIVDKYDVDSVFSRFKSLQSFSQYVDYNDNDIKFYYGMYLDGTLEYGIELKDRIPFGTIRMNDVNLKWVKSLDSKGAVDLKRELNNLNSKKITLLGNVSKELLNYIPNNFKGTPEIEFSEGSLNIHFEGLGMWNSGILEDESLELIKKDFKEWSKNKKWKKSLLYKVTPENLSVKITLKVR